MGARLKADGIRMAGGDGFLPTLLDRLVEATSNNGQALSRRAYQETVVRDLQWLLNTISPLSREAAETYPHLSDSVLNYGIPATTGASMTESELESLANDIKQAIVTFEARVLPDSLSVEVLGNREAAIRSQLVFRISASFWFDPFPVELSLLAQWDVENGLVSLKGDG